MPYGSGQTERPAGGPAAANDSATLDAVLLDAADRCLRSGRFLDSFGPVLEARFEADTRQDRIRQIRYAVFIGILVFNIYNLTGLVTLPDWWVLNLVLRAAVVTPVGLFVYWASSRVGGGLREMLCAGAMVGANGVPILLMALEGGPRIYLCTAEIMLSIVFGSNVLPLRFSWACIVSAVTAVLATTVVLTKSDIPIELGLVIVIDLLVMMNFTLMAARRTEAANRRDYLLTLRETLRGRRLAEDNTMLARLSTTDSLTGLANRRRFARSMGDLWQGAVEGRRFALILLDVDHFKLFNDRYGHSAGDDCLRAIAAILARHATGPSDVAARYGGEEFAVLLPGRTLVQALEVAEALRRGVEDLAVPHAARKDGLGRVTVSLGVAISSQAASDAALVEAADLALYAAKEAGRNRIQSPAGPRRRDDPAVMPAA
ncbi:sensor domain-containing diguanylate cyclase [Methylobacterium sp. Leaf466]|uniref:GGDEF domain-containing protein n=1 Tax=Methylobacterium sp. Leaf466 TaxID=1736386 RepID=UPI000700E151|nr:sensor domain-containing diguanylate cyclase [Methylobacterium sp. Leaf466]KQT78202.1 hypothetical protein ASG59_09460 [Methylobacterium sp. Leaf466]